MKWFNHDIDTRNDDKIFELIEAHGMMGYGLWWLVVEELYAAEKTGFQIEATETWFKRIAKQANLTDWRSLGRVLDTMAEQKLIDAQLWAEHVIHCPGIIKRADTYVQKKALNAKRQATFREKGKSKKEQVSQEGNALLTHNNADVTLSYANANAEDQSQIQDQDLISTQTIDLKDLRTAEPRTCETGEGVIFGHEESKPILTLVKPPSNQNSFHSPPPCSAPPPQDGLNLIFQIYNQDKPEHWAACKALNEKRKKVVRAFLKEHKERSVEIFQAALSFAAQDPFWSDPKKRFDFDTVFEKNRAVQFSERWEESSRETRGQRGERLAREALQELIQERGYGFEAC